MTTPALSPKKVPEFQPFVPPHESRPEFTARAVLLGCFFGLVFGAVTVYVGLEAGLTVAASIPIAVLSISILRAFGRASILENNIVQTTGNAGQSIAAGVIFTLPALIFLGFDLEYSRIFILALIGGWLGVLFMIPLRRQLIVEEHGNLTYPEGTACADVLIAGERAGSFAEPRVYGPGTGVAVHAVPERVHLQSLAGHAGVSAGLRAGAHHEGRIDQGRRHARVSGRGLHHRTARGGGAVCWRRVFLAGGDAADLLFRQEPAPSAVSRHRADCADGAERFVVHLCAADWRGRGGRGGADYARQDAADDFRRAGLRLSALCARSRARRPDLSGPKTICRWVWWCRLHSAGGVHVYLS